MLGAARRITELDRRIRQEKEGLWGVMKNLGSGLEGKHLASSEWDASDKTLPAKPLHSA